MKIGYVLKIFPKISEKFVINEIMELIKMGHEIYIFSIYHPEEKIIYPEKMMHNEILQNNLLKNIYYPPYISRSISELTGYVSLLSGHSNNIIYNELCRNAARYFAKIIKDSNLKIDILHAHFATEPAFVAMTLSNMLGIPFTIMAHAYDIYMDPDIGALKERFDNASAVMTASYYNMEYINSLGIDKNKIHVIRACPNLYELDNIKRRDNINGRNLLSISRLVEKKGIKYGILAIKNLIKEYPEITYRVIGSGPLEKELRSLIKSLGLENNVKIIGNLDNEKLNEELSRTTIFILPCTIAKNGDIDGIPVSLMEAMYLQIPTISTKISGIQELIENGKSGLLVDINNDKQLSDSVKILLENRELMIKIGNCARKKVEKDFNLHNEAQKLIDIWNLNIKDGHG